MLECTFSPAELNTKDASTINYSARQRVESRTSQKAGHRLLCLPYHWMLRVILAVTRIGGIFGGLANLFP